MFPLVCFKGKTPEGSPYIIRKYCPADRERVRLICSETGFLGSPQEPFFYGREEFADLWSAYWTDYGPAGAFVAEVDVQVEGYLLGCLDTRRQEKVWKSRIVPDVGRRMLRREWWKHPQNRAMLRALARENLYNLMQSKQIPFMEEVVREYPAHLHTNIADSRFRGAGLGKRLMIAYLRFLKERGIKGVHLGTTSHNREAVPFYRHMGFEVLVKRRMRIYDHVIAAPPLYFLCMGQKL